MPGAETFSSSMEGARNYNAWIVRRFRPYVGHSMLEIGIGHGGFRPFFPDLERYVGVDIDAGLVRRALELYPGETFVVADAASPTLVDRAGASFDSVLCVNVLEHIKDHRTALANLAAALRPGGHLLLLVPAFGFLYNDLDRLAGHVRRYTKTSLVAALPDGVDLVEAGYFNPVGALGWALNNFMSHRSLETREVRSQVALFDRWLVPVSRGIDPLTRRLFGQSVVCVARKRP